ncbi:50S ribosomal protein L11 methyltransferase [Allosphingosinicella vermicomposti]|uniref:50S ribosomal protein L11 methyltransferase n=1 Tax=Allosphingosinicella vermicomposti TaxID=614671 RepID=UPI000D0F30EA|nr:50S ribosomal protein L11 methyltransferase [Allosphingosinicella vermicomposti]
MSSWKITLPCTKAEAEAVEREETPFATLDNPPVIMSSEPDETRPDEWRLDGYFEEEPTADDIALFRTLAPSSAGMDPVVEQLPEEDWVTLSQQGLEPIRAGRFFVHTPAHRDNVPADAIALEIDAGRAFGTGQHETTTGCLMAADRLKEQAIRFDNILDLGTGTGLLAFAALKLWPDAKVAASDIDPVSIEVSDENAGINSIPVGTGKGEVELIVAPGMEHARLAARAPYDLIIANILAGPLIELAPSVADALAPGGRLILAGLLNTQAEAVTAAYRRQGLMGSFDIVRGDWTILTMRKRKALGWQ